jgi:uncharacterized protein YlxP (DUF503 family)
VTVSLLRFTLFIDDAGSIKDKRRVVNSLKDRVRRKFGISIAEVDMLDTLRFAGIGAAVVSNSKEQGERVLHKVVDFIEDQGWGRYQDISITTEFY